jgi:DNA polymerase-4
VERARQACPQAAFLPGDLEAYARAGDEITQILLAASRRVERPSIDEAFVDLTQHGAGGALRLVETIKDELQQRLGLDASLGLATSRLAARAASDLARPRGLLVLLPGYEAQVLQGRPLTLLGDLPDRIVAGLQVAGITTLGQLAAADEAVVARLAGQAGGARLRALARGEDERPIELLGPPSSVHEAAVVHAGGDREALLELLRSLAARAVRRLRPFDLSAGALTVEVRRDAHSLNRTASASPRLSDEDEAGRLATDLAAPLLEAPGARAIEIRLSRLAPRTASVPRLSLAR